uniref:C2H2-type domain-containing protein n=1 Tax=Solanum lycopersicum TaxID=4081 RepID=A0A3Q7IFA0_SOLLC
MSITLLEQNQCKPDTIFSGEKSKAKALTKEVADKPSLSSSLLVECLCDDLISSPNINDLPSLLIDNNVDNLRNNTAHEKQNNKEFTFWCETCKISTFSEKTIEAHRVGKKHVWNLQQLTGKDKQC